MYKRQVLVILQLVKVQVVVLQIVLLQVLKTSLSVLVQVGSSHQVVVIHLWVFMLDMKIRLDVLT